MTTIHDDTKEALWADLAEETSFPKVRPLLAHYTSVEVLEKILTNDQMWLSNPLYMNDREELRYGMSIGAARFRSHDALLEACGSNDIHAKLVGFFDDLFNEFDRKHAIDTYVLCFSEHPRDNTDGLLSMWRGYGAGGNGVALVFDTAKLGAIEHSPLIVGNVHYRSPRERLDWIDGKLTKLVAVLRAHSKTDDNLFLLAQSWIERLKLFALFTKHSGFSEEREWRVVYMSERDQSDALTPMLSYLVTARGVEPKLKLKLASKPGVMDDSASFAHLIDRIILGPSISTVLAMTSIQKMVTIAGKPDLAQCVVASSIPFRSH